MILISSKNLARAFQVFIFESRYTFSFTAAVIITIQNTLAKSHTVLTQTGIQVIIVRIVLKND